MKEIFPDKLLCCFGEPNEEARISPEPLKTAENGVSFINRIK